MCKKCKELLELKKSLKELGGVEAHIVLAEGSWTTLKAVVDRQGKYYLRASGEGMAEVHIKYCPFCGEKLC